MFEEGEVQPSKDQDPSKGSIVGEGQQTRSFIENSDSKVAHATTRETGVAALDPQPARKFADDATQPIDKFVTPAL
nr:hypothetical protein CFP56_06499 [Quercus suber]